MSVEPLDIYQSVQSPITSQEIPHGRYFDASRTVSGSVVMLPQIHNSFPVVFCLDTNKCIQNITDLGADKYHYLLSFNLPFIYISEKYETIIRRTNQSDYSSSHVWSVPHIFYWIMLISGHCAHPYMNGLSIKTIPFLCNWTLGIWLYIFSHVKWCMVVSFVANIWKSRALYYKNLNISQVHWTTGNASFPAFWNHMPARIGLLPVVNSALCTVVWNTASENTGDWIYASLFH